MTKNFANEIKSFLKQSTDPVEAKVIYEEFIKNRNYPRGTVAGGLKRLVDNGEIAQPSRGQYTNMNSKNVYDDLKNELQAIITKYSNINWPIIQAMSDEERKHFTEAIDILKKIANWLAIFLYILYSIYKLYRL